MSSRRKTRKAPGKEHETSRRRGEAEDRPAELRPAALLRAALREETRSHLDGASRADTLLLIQQTRGNAYVQRLMQPATAAIQREGGRGASRVVPGLPAEAVEQIETHLSNDPQAALDRLTAALAGRGGIDLSFLAGETMTYVADKSGMAPGHYGHTSITPGDGRPRPCIVVVGPDAFQSVSDLYTTVMHEWKHVLQFRKPDAATEAMDELEASLWEVENLDQTGLGRDLDYLKRISGVLDNWWNLLTPEETAAMKQRYVSARAIITRKRFELDEKAKGNK